MSAGRCARDIEALGSCASETVGADNHSTAGLARGHAVLTVTTDRAITSSTIRPRTSRSGPRLATVSSSANRSPIPMCGSRWTICGRRLLPGAFFPLTNGSTAVGYLATNFNITLTTSKNPDPGTEGVNFAESGARIFVGPNPPATQPRSLTQQVAEFQNYVASNSVTFNPSTTLFFLAGGLNDHNRITQAEANAATTVQVATLYSLGARLFEIALLPSLVPAFSAPTQPF
jgi:hypothetical protein